MFADYVLVVVVDGALSFVVVLPPFFPFSRLAAYLCFVVVVFVVVAGVGGKRAEYAGYRGMLRRLMSCDGSGTRR